MTHTLRLIYHLAIKLYVAAIAIASVFNKKAKLWINGRKHVLDDLHGWRKLHPGKLIWMHCASLGEFEQGRPVIESIKKEFPDMLVLLTFFSPSGYEVRKHYSGAEFVCYLPADTTRNAKEFIQLMHPSLVLIVKYEYWANYFLELKRNHIPLFIVAGILRPDQRFFGLFSGFWKKVLDCVTHFYVQDESTFQLLQKHGYENATLAGDTRFDRVAEIASSAKPIDELAKFRGAHFCIVAGSSWEPEEKILAEWHQKNRSKDHRLIIVPHEIDEAHILSLMQKFPAAIRWSKRGGVDLSNVTVLIIDVIGLLSVAYRYGNVAVIGGGFGRGIHNTLEAAVWGMPVLFGPRYSKFTEAVGLIQAGGAFSVNNSDEMHERLDLLRNQRKELSDSGVLAGKFVQARKGATEVIMMGLRKKI